MALAVGSSVSTINGTAQTAGGTTNLSIAILGTNLIVVAIAAWNNGGTGTGCSSVTRGAQNFTLVPSSGSTNGSFYTEIWQLASPTSGTADIVATVSGKTDKLGLAAVVFSGADTTTPIDDKNTATGTASIITATVNTSVTGDVLVDSVSRLGSSTSTARSGSTIYDSAFGTTAGGSQYQTSSSTGSNSASWTYSGTNTWAYSVVSVKNPTGTAGTTSGLAIASLF